MVKPTILSLISEQLKQKTLSSLQEIVLSLDFRTLFLTVFFFVCFLREGVQRGAQDCICAVSLNNA